MKNTNITFIAILAIAILAGTASNLKAQAPTCLELGYNKTECGSNKAIKCPTDTSRVFCVEKCPSVNVSKYEICTKKCADDANVCIEKRDMTCNEYINANNGEKIADGANVIGTKTKNLYLMGTAKDVTGSNAYLNRIKLVNANVYSAVDIPACKAEGAKEAFFNVSHLTLEGRIHFDVKTKIGYVYFTPQTTTYWSAVFERDAEINLNMRANSTWATSLTLDFDGNDKSTTNNKVNITCEASDASQGSTWYKDPCNLTINSYQANVTYCKNIVGNAEVNISCDTGVCQEAPYSCWY